MNGQEYGDGTIISYVETLSTTTFSFGVGVIESEFR